MFDSLNFFKKQKTSQLGVELDHLSNLYLNPLSSQKIKKAVSFADKAHQGQFRKSGEPFIIHPINVGMILASLKMVSFDFRGGGHFCRALSLSETTSTRSFAHIICICDPGNPILQKLFKKHIEIIRT